MDDVFARYGAALRMGHQLAAEGRFKDALSEYEQAARVAGERALPHVLVGAMLARLGRAKHALAAYERALALEPGNLDALGGKAAALLAAGRRSEATAVQGHIAELRRGPGVERRTPAGLLTPLTRADELAAAGAEALSGGERDAAIEAWLSEAREHATEKRFDASLDAALRALAVDTGSVPVHVELARIYAQRGWDEEAADHVAGLRRLLELMPEVSAGSMLDDLVSPPSPA